MLTDHFSSPVALGKSLSGEQGWEVEWAYK